MEPEFIEFIRNARKRKVSKFRNQFYVFLVCLIISIFLWILVHLSKEYYYTTEYRLTYSHVPWNLKMTGSSDSLLNLTIRLQGYEFFSEQFFRRSRRTYEVSLRGMKLKAGEDQVNGFLLTRGIARKIAEQTTYPLEIITTSPDTLFFTFEKKPIRRMTPAKTLPITLNPSKSDTAAATPDSIRGNVYPSEIKSGSTGKKGGK